MLYTENIKKAINFMFEKQKNQVDKGRIPYVFHPWHIAEQFNEEKRVIVALLHDVLEDTETTIEELQNEKFDNQIITALRLLKYEKDKDYFEYIKSLASNKIARDVKIEDLKHNLDLSRLEIISEKDLKRVEKYKESLKYLENY